MFVEHRRRGHQMADIANKQQRAAGQFECAVALGCGVFAVGIERACEGLAAFVHFFHQRAVHQTEPVGIHQRFVFAIHRRYRIFAIHNGGERGFENHIFHTGRILRADGALFVD